MKILLTGITGFVGQNLMPMLLRECPEFEFMTLNVNLDEAKSLFPEEEYRNFIHHQLSDMKYILDFNPHIVIHLATLTSPRNDSEIIKPMIESNLEFGILLLDTLIKCDNLKLFINTGSFAEYRFGPQRFDNAYLYSVTKTAFRFFLDYYSSLAGFKYITAVPYSIYGGNMTIKRIMDYIKESLNTSIPVDMTSGEQVLDFIHVNDIASFYTYLLKDFNKILNFQNGQEFHLGTGRGTSIKELAYMIEKKYNKKCNINWGGRPYRERDIMYAVAPIAKNIELIDWKAKISLYEGI